MTCDISYSAIVIEIHIYWHKSITFSYTNTVNSRQLDFQGETDLFELQRFQLKDALIRIIDLS